MKTCKKCGKEKTLDEMAKSTSSKSGRQSICKRCEAERARAYYELNAEKAKARVSRYQKRNPKKRRDPLKQAARRALRYAVRTGKIVRPDECEECGAAAKQIDGHHPDYSRPFDVVWLCPGCHGKRHRTTEDSCRHR